MKIQNSQVALAGLQKNEQLSSRLRDMTVNIATNPSSANNSNSNAGENESSAAETQSQQAGIRLSLSQRTHETKHVSSVSTVTRISDQEVSQFAASFVAEQINTQETEAELTVTGRTFPGQFLGGQQVAVEVYSVLETDSRESLSLEALGKVTTEDGRQIDFMMALDFNRNIHSEQINVFSGNRDLIDPLMMSLDGNAVSLSEKTFQFDLDADGHLDAVSQTAAGSGYLVFDKNQNGMIDDGREMFGPQTGQGFAELAEYDEDGNGWIDENDSIFSQLQFMTFDEESGDRQLQTLSDSGVGAMYLGSVSSNYALHSEAGQFQGTIKETGIALSEQGQTLLLQEVHLSKIVADTSLEVITNIEGSAVVMGGSVQDIDNALNFFQFDNQILNARDAETRVSLSNNGNPQSIEEFVRAGPLPESVQTEPAADHNAEAIKAAVAFNQAVDADRDLRASAARGAGLVSGDDLARDTNRQSLRDWVSESMQGFESIRDSNAENNQTVNVFDSAYKEPNSTSKADYLNLDKESGDVKLQEMRSMIESLRAMREQMEAQQSELSVYLNIDQYTKE